MKENPAKKISATFHPKKPKAKVHDQKKSAQEGFKLKKIFGLSQKSKNRRVNKSHDKFFLQLIWITPAFVFIAMFIFYAAFIVFKNGFNKYPFDIKWAFTWKVFEVVAQDSTFTVALRNSLLYVAIVLPIGMILSVAVAKALSSILNKRLFSFLQGFFFLPYVTSAMAVAMAFSFMFTSNSSGIFNRLVGWFGGQPIAWMNDPRYAIWTVLIFGIWKSLPFQIVMMTAAFMRVNPQYYAAASIDGMKRWKQFWKISIPQVIPMIIYLVTIGIISSFKALPLGLFGTEKAAEVVNAQTIVFWIYDRTTGASGIQSNQLAAAASIILLAIILAVTIVNRFITNALGKRYK